MDKQQILEHIVEKEWQMFHSANSENRVSCQEDRTTFEAMRRAQFSAWSDDAAGCYLDDLTLAERDGRNLVREKYIHMMKTTDPAGYEHFKVQLPAVSPEKERITALLMARFLEQTKRMREKYPIIALAGRPLYAEEEKPGEASIETYQLGELMTYSEGTLQALLRHMEALEKGGVDLAFEIQKNPVLCMGYSSLEDAEKAMAYQLIQQMGGNKCPACSGMFSDSR